MRILHVSQPTDGGTAQVVRQLVRRGVSAGDDVVVMTPADPRLQQWVCEEGATWAELRVARAPGIDDLRAIRTLRRHMGRYDVVHLHSSKAGAVGRIAALLRVGPKPRVVFTAHGWSWYVGGRAAPAYKLFERIVAPVAHATVAVSHRELDDGRRVLGRRARISVIANGVDVEDFTPEGERADRGSQHLVVQVGRLSRQKGQDRAIAALAQLGREDVTLRMVGDGDALELRRLAARLDLISQVEFVGEADPRPHLRAADVVILPSRWEGMALALLEAMSVGSAVLATDVAGVDALGDAGIVVPNQPDEQAVRALARGLAHLLDSADLRTALGAQARRRAVRDHDVRTTTSAYERLWTTTR